MNREKTLGFPSSGFGFLEDFMPPKERRDSNSKEELKVQGGVDGSSEEVDGGLRSPQPEQKMNGSTSGADEMGGGLESDQPNMLFASGADEMDGGLKSDPPNMLFVRREKIGADVHRKEKKWDYLMVTLEDQKRRFSEMALQHYNTKKNCRFEFVQAMHSEKLKLFSRDCVEDWCHISFIAGPKNGEVEKYFFAELRKKGSESTFSVEECCVLESEECGGFNYGCLICPPVLTFHPREGKYIGGASSYRPVKRKWVTRSDLVKVGLRKG